MYWQPPAGGHPSDDEPEAGPVPAFCFFGQVAIDPAHDAEPPPSGGTGVPTLATGFLRPVDDRQPDCVRRRTERRMRRDPSVRGARSSRAARSVMTGVKGEQIMAKGQLRSNKEVRKPKKDKKAAPAPTPFGAQVKQANEAASKKK